MIICIGMFAYAPFLVINAPYESTMGLVQKIFYFHVAAAMTMFLSAFVAAIAAALFLFGRKTAADRVAVSAAELAVLFGLIVLDLRSLVGAQGLGCLVAMGRAAHLDAGDVAGLPVIPPAAALWRARF